MNYKHTFSYAALLMCLGSTVTSCEDLLNQEPPSYIVPEDYYRSVDQIEAVANNFYGMLPSHGGQIGIYGWDTNTDNQTTRGSDGKYYKDQWKTGLDNGNWSWGDIRNVNYQLNTVLSRYNNKEISGDDKSIRQYIGELYFFRAYAYFNALKNWGDFPIVTTAMPDNEAVLVKANKRRPRNEVARFIINTLDTANTYMTPDFSARHTRVSVDVANLIKSRVALFEASWLTNFKGTPFVPNGPKWPGAAKDYNKNYQFPTGSIDGEIKYFLEQATASAEKVADKYMGKMVVNTGIVPQNADDQNPYFYMFGTTDMSVTPEVLLWKQYSRSLSVTNQVESGVERGNYLIGLTRGYIESYVMEDGKPRYAQHNGFTYDDNSIGTIRRHADPRLKIFLKEPGQINYFKNSDDKSGEQANLTEGYPAILDASDDYGCSTGYTLRKGGTFDKSLASNWNCYNAACSFRATEALLNYIEAEYMLTKNVNAGKIMTYWKKVRECAGFKGAAIDPMTTINATDMNKETAGLANGTAYDWGAFSGGKVVDKITYCIRRERRSELIGEGMRWADLIRWRSLDQLKKFPYHIEGFKLWNSAMTSWYPTLKPENYDGSGSATVSAPSLSDYLRPLERNTTSGNIYRNGMTWFMAHYLQPMPIKQMMLTAPDHTTPSESPLYQNPYWSMEPNQYAEE